MTPKYSFIIPAYNEEALLARTLDILSESAAEIKGGFEIIVANDDSTDRTAEIAREKGARVIDVKKRQIAAVRNAGASIASGEILVFVDADTHVTAKTLLAMEKLFLERPDVVAGGAVMNFDVIPPWWGRIGVRVFTFFYFHLAQWIAGGFFFVRHDAFKKVGGWDEQYFASEEIHLSNALKKVGKIEILREPVITSARKFRMKKAGDHIALLKRAVRTGFKGFRSREGLEMWYDGSREK